MPTGADDVKLDGAHTIKLLGVWWSRWCRTLMKAEGSKACSEISRWLLWLDGETQSEASCAQLLSRRASRIHKKDMNNESELSLHVCEGALLCLVFRQPQDAGSRQQTHICLVPARICFSRGICAGHVLFWPSRVKRNLETRWPVDGRQSLSEEEQTKEQTEEGEAEEVIRLAPNVAGESAAVVRRGAMQKSPAGVFAVQGE
ncbi:uncharacterized protein BDR25DRAFT_345205 [Lindgomyces ingoldianus]|uniref:Uncharacterized protein n=1 Tax=Lindgomyces ingoldianus TaxID=673940 RepID=A0ACB6QLL0_9PLEO|nr:uncharacterized protein BDR25DRAFT_345205 [Lindgomyces ingoldianus]KAF2467031.1 hypothetical protein BDR25DRAFT_345205 [Lindgomyces ingoldianus]